MQGALHGVSISRNGSRASHLLFADDTLIFPQATREALLCIRDLLQRFEEASGLAINWQKSAAVFGKNETAVSRKELGRVLGDLVVDKHEKYLGLPTVIGCLTGAVFDHIKIRIWNKM
ncbi:UNVERIFIED_CONTAM: hypothetical protein Scaly_0986000 [Sesamum calycinum]|uniref:Reverse transcriptase domain-containing protein n=1 Tax=Sesamum calycinum TaxID=2727403 RepID=A0AAW2QZ46_9LAMI